MGAKVLPECDAPAGGPRRLGSTSASKRQRTCHDVVGIVVPYDQVLDVLQESHRKGTGSAIVILAGFAECGVDDRRDLQGELGAFARASGMRISGPNCLGLANVKHDIWATSSSRGASGLTGPIGLVCQSGATAFGPFLVRAVENGIGFSYIISTGNEADLTDKIGKIIGCTAFMGGIDGVVNAAGIVMAPST